MEIIADLHTHTIASSHAYATVTEMAAAAEAAGLKAIAITDHGPATPDSPHIYHFSNLRVLPPKLNNVVILKGIETNVLDDSGATDLDEYEDIAKRLDIVIASMHEPVMKRGMGRDYYTRAWLGVIKNPYIDILGHMGDGRFEFDIDAVIKAAAEAGKAVEINNASFTVRKGSAENCPKIAAKCLEYGVKIAVSSDSHFTATVGKFPKSLDITEKIGIPREQIINSSVRNLSDFLNSREYKNKIIF